MCEAASIINTRPLTTDTLNDPLSPEPLTPNHLLMAKSHIVLPPPGEFVREDLNSRNTMEASSIPYRVVLDQVEARISAALASTCKME